MKQYIIRQSWFSGRNILLINNSLTVTKITYYIYHTRITKFLNTQYTGKTVYLPRLKERSIFLITKIT
jgi:hypothetical protein